jgi:YVTN family beta-propeller protein
MAGPRALAVKYPRAGVAGDPGARVYCLNRLDNSVSVIDPITDTLVATFPLRFDPTPLHIKNGRKFLYDARLSGNGFVSCASCHQDGRADFLLWDLSDGVTVPFNPALNGGISAPPSNPTWPGNKGRLMTQSLQGMLNAEVDGRAQPFFTNEPLHWRADRRTFEDFNGAFPNLLGGAPLGTAEMAAFRAFVMSIHYPPNPEQDLTRRPRGVFGTPDALDGSGAARGLKLSAIRALTSTSAGGTLAAGRSCIQCHEPPEGSENLVTMFDTSRSTPGVLQPLETTQVRMTRHKERRFEKGPAGLSTIRTGMFGIGHEGGLDSINDFTDGTFGRSFPGSGEVRDVIQLFREWDSGTGPLVGRPVTIDIGNRSAAVGLLAFYEAQAAQANCGVAVHGRIAGAPRGFWFDLAGAAPVYREEPSGATFTRAALLAQLATADDLLVFTAVPLGSERRFATLSPSPPPPLLGPSPSSLTLEPMPATPFWQDLPRLTFNWDIVGPSPFRWLSTQPEPRILRTKRIAQKGLVTDGAGLNLGITAPRHEAPRRLAVAGDGIRHGASLVLFLPLDPASPPPPALQPPFTWLWLPIHPTERRNTSGRQIWETHVELEPLTAYTLMLGGHAAPNVAALLNGTFAQEPPAVGTFAPGAWNRYWIAVVNADGTFGLTFGERVRMH